MEHLLTFVAASDPSKDETKLFEAFHIGFKAFDHPEWGEEAKLSRSANREISKKTIDGTSIRFQSCILCGSRAGHFGDNLRTLPRPSDENPVLYVDLIFGEKTWPYIKARFPKWKAVPEELRDLFIELDERFEAMKPKERDEIDKLVKMRTAPASISETVAEKKE